MEFDPRLLRNVYGRFATGVCVVTANDTEQKPFGMTVNSFSSVSLEPPLILWSIQNDSECFTLFDKADAFAVNILRKDQEELSRYYATKYQHHLQEQVYTLGEAGQPLLKNTLAAIECKVWANYPGGDHTIIVGEVKNVVDNGETQEPLLFYSGGYARIK